MTYTKNYFIKGLIFSYGFSKARLFFFLASYDNVLNFTRLFVITFTAVYQNIFPLANTFAKRENVMPGQPPTGTQMRSFRGLFIQACARH